MHNQSPHVVFGKYIGDLTSGLNQTNGENRIVVFSILQNRSRM